MSLSPMQMPTSLSFRSGTTTREPTVIGFASPSSTAEVNVWKRGSGRATWTKRVAISRTLKRRREIHAWRGCGAESGRIGELHSAALDRDATERIVRQQRRSVEVGCVEQRRDLSDGGNAERALDHAACHNLHVQGSRRVNHPQRLTEASALCKLDVDAIDGSRQLGNIRSDKARLVSKNRQL